MAAAASPNGGILRRPRYSSSLSSASATTNDNNNDDAGIVVVDVTPSKAASSDSDDNNSPRHHPRPPPHSTTPSPHSLTPTTTMPSNNSGHSGGKSRKYPLRSLAEMVKSVTDLNNEASLDYFASVDYTTTDDDDRNIVHSKSILASSSMSSRDRNDRTALHATENSSDEPNNDPLLLISNNNGIPYMNINNNDSSITTTSSSPRPNVDDATVVDSTKNPIIDAVGVIGDNGQGVVRFCEYEQVSSYNDEGNKTMTTTIKDRLGGDRNTIIIDMDNPNVDTNVLKEGRTNNINDIDDDETADSDSESYGSGTGDEDILHELGMSNFFNNDNNDQDEEEEEYDDVINDQHVRPFRVLWEILTRWATPSTVDLVLTYQRIQQYEQQTLQQNDDIHHLGGSSSSTNENTATVPRNDVDIGASRQAGIMSMIKMHVPRALAELQRIKQRGEVVVNVNNNNNNNNTSSEEKIGLSNQKLVEQRLANLVRTFDPSVPAVNLSTKLWKGLTTILISVAFFRSDDNIVVLPPSILVLDMTAAEYRYLTCSVYTSLCSVD